jgi:catechol 2,3-dioxygenase-like lactoylglutathione lyase family enzyme
MAIGAFGAGAAQSTAPAQPPKLDLAGIAHAAIRVADLDKSRAFYAKLGYEEAFAMSQNGVTSQSFIKINDRQFLELYPQREPSQPIGFMHVCFEAADINELNQAYIVRGLSPIPVRRAAAGNLLFTMAGPEQQNIEYTQYMPGSKHTNDRGQHLGPTRISTEIVAIGIEMQDPAAAAAFYEQKLGFVPVPSLDPGKRWLGLPGGVAQQVEMVQHGPGSTLQLFFGVADLRRTAAQLKKLQIPVEKHDSHLSIQDPDGNRIVFLKAKPA